MREINPSDAENGGTHIVIAVDGSSSSLEAVRYGIQLVQAGLLAHITLLHVQEPASLLELATHDADAIAEAAIEAGEHLMAPAIELLERVGVDYTTEVTLGAPGTVLPEMAEQLRADMLIVGARGISAIQRALMGSVSQAVLNRSTLPVVVVKARASAQDVLDESPGSNDLSEQ